VRKLIFAVTFLCSLTSNGQNYNLTFSGTGASSNVSTVNVENLTSGTTLTLSGSDILRLTGTTNVNSIENKKSSELRFYPNPMVDNAVLEIFPSESGDAIISVHDMSGRLMVQVKYYLEKNIQEFRLSGINSGLYLVSVKGEKYQYSGKLLSISSSAENVRIEKINSKYVFDNKIINLDSKGLLATVDMAYTTGDRLKFTGISGNFSTVITDIPLSDKTITFDFLSCTDGDNNNYSIVVIGTQTWMAENLKTTKYNDAVSIPNVTDNFDWYYLRTPAYRWYNNDISYKNTYGALYNWFCAKTAMLCPTGWHVPDDNDWMILIEYSGSFGSAGWRLKESGTSHWSSPNSGVTNETGFTALPGGENSGNTGSYDIGRYATLWSTSEFDFQSANSVFLTYNYANVSIVTDSKGQGFSVRCIKD
jgi:uncharacterized protein (TIGR02145 family)